jgi:hypothetical protein
LDSRIAKYMIPENQDNCKVQQQNKQVKSTIAREKGGLSADYSSGVGW